MNDVPAPVPGPSRNRLARRASFVLSGAALLFVFSYHLVPGLVAGLLVHSLLVASSRRLRGRLLSHGAARIVAAVLLGVLAAGATAGFAIGIRAFVRGHVGDLPGLFGRMAGIVEKARAPLAALGVDTEAFDRFVDGEELMVRTSEWLREHGGELGRVGSDAGRGLLHVVMGIAVGVLVFFGRARKEGWEPPPLAAALSERVSRLGASFRAVVRAQVEISAFNMVLTALYLFGVVPLVSGERLPLSGTLLAVTFLAGLLPVVGNLLSNTAVVVLSLGVSGWLALGSLGFLVAVHKLEYLLNARLVGHRVHAAAWEILLAIVVFEVAFGVPGVVMAPVVYAWAKSELEAEGLV